MRDEDRAHRDRIISEIKSLAKAHGGRAPGVQLFERETGIKPSSWSGRIWARWGDALQEAGLAPNALTRKSDPALLLRKLCEASRHFGRMPSTPELRLYHRNIDPDFPSHGTFGLNFGPKADLLMRLREWVESQPEYHDVLAMLPSVNVATKARIKRGAGIDGSVYLIKSGKHFKIGKSDDLERRIKEIRIALPEASILEHVITTDDPTGIEAYWHRRFAERRANGEWFALTPQDVLAFKRRKFQ